MLAVLLNVQITARVSAVNESYVVISSWHNLTGGNSANGGNDECVADERVHGDDDDDPVAASDFSIHTSAHFLFSRSWHDDQVLHGGSI